MEKGLWESPGGIRILPEECTLFMTNRCNFQCAGCSRSVLGVKEYKDMNIDSVQRLLSLYPSIKAFCVAGLGEPTLCTNFVEIVNYLMSKNKYIGIITNGTNVNKLLELEHDPGYISISLYGYNRESYINHTCIDAYERVIENYNKLAERFQRVGFSYVVRTDNYRTLDKILSLCDRLKPSFVNLVNYLVYDPKNTEELKKIISVTDVDIKEHIEKICQGREYVQTRPIYADFNNTEFSCQSYNYLINLDGDGNIGGCQRQVPPDFSFGNIFSNDDPFNTSAMRELRANVEARNYPHEKCHFCFGRIGQNMRSAKTEDTSKVSEVDIAVLILFYEKAEQTIECVKSFLQSNVNIYILNNNSSTSSRDKLRAFCKAYNQIKIFDSDINLGVGIGRNFLITHTTEEWLLFIDNDIVIKTQHWIQKIVHHISDNRDIEVFIPRLFNVHEDSYVSYNRITIEEKKVLHRPLINNLTNHFPGGASFVSRRLFNRLGLYDDEMFIELEDCEICIRAILSGVPIKAKLIEDIDLIHDHRPLKSIEDKKSVFVRYNPKNGEKSFKRIAEKYPEFSFEHEWRAWVSNQLKLLLSKENINLIKTSPAENFGCKAGCRTIPLLHRNHEKIAQINDLYTETLKLANSLRAKRFINFGYRIGAELADYFHNEGIQTTDVNFKYQQEEKGQIANCISIDLTDYRDLEFLFSKLNTDEIQMFLISNTLERLEDPRPLLRTLKRLLVLNPSNRIVISTPDRSKMYGEHFIDIPANNEHIREWSLNELVLFLSSSGFVIEDARNISNGPIIASFIVLSLTRDEYDMFLQAFNLPPSSIVYLMLTNEHGKAKLTGGIGSYVEEMEYLLSKKAIGICLLGKGDLLPDDWLIHEERWIIPNYFFASQYLDGLPMGDATFQTFEQIVYFYPDLSLVECQDVEGYGYRLAQAKCAGLLPPNIHTKICCHGSKIYLESNYQIWLDMSVLQLLHEEKIAIELADIVHFPTRFLHQLYVKAGYEIDENKIKIQRLPFTYKHEAVEKSYEKIDTLIFFGKRHRSKGYTNFAEAIKILFKIANLDNETDELLNLSEELKDQIHLFKDIKRIILLGPKTDLLKEENTFFESLGSKMEIVEMSLKREDAISAISSYASSAICIMPYPNDNHPYSILESINTGCQILAANAGGIPELIPEKFHPLFLCESSSQSIAGGILKAVAVPLQERKKNMSQLYQEVINEQRLINDQIRSSVYNIDSQSLGNYYSIINYKTSTMLVVCHNTNLVYIEELIFALNQQRVKPDEIIFVDDMSTDEYIGKLKQLLSDKLSISHKVICNSTRKGDNGAKNIGLKNVETDLIIYINPNNLPKVTFVESYLNYFNQNPTVSAVTSYCAILKDQTDWQKQENIIDTFRPLGDASMLSGQYMNYFGHSNSAYKTDFLKKIGGWDESIRNIFDDDWLLFLKIISLKGKIGVIPKPTVIRRTCQNAIVTSQYNYSLQQGIAFNTLALSRFDAFRMQSLMQQYLRNGKKDGIAADHFAEREQYLMQEIHNLQQSKALLLDRKLRKHPLLFKPISTIFNLLVKTYKNVKDNVSYFSHN